jgi:hypothetical protein
MTTLRTTFIEDSFGSFVEDQTFAIRFVPPIELTIGHHRRAANAMRLVRSDENHFWRPPPHFHGGCQLRINYQFAPYHLWRLHIENATCEAALSIWQLICGLEHANNVSGSDPCRSSNLCLLDKRMQHPNRGLPVLHRDKQTDRMRR